MHENLQSHKCLFKKVRFLHEFFPLNGKKFDLNIINLSKIMTKYFEINILKLNIKTFNIQKNQDFFSKNFLTVNDSIKTLSEFYKLLYAATYAKTQSYILKIEEISTI